MTTTQLPSIVSRLAPTPSGFLHAGNAFSFVLTWLVVRKMGGRLWLRIDDIDAARKRPEYVEDIFRTLEWLGLDYDAGPQGPDDFERNFSQHLRLDLYRAVLDELKEVPSLIYSCKCSRKEVQQRSTNGLYPGTCRQLGRPLEARGCALRVQLPHSLEVSFKAYPGGEEQRLNPGRQMGDFVIRKKDGLPAYQLVSLADDMENGVNLVVRGNDLCESTAAQLYLAGCIQQKSTKFQAAAGEFIQTRFLHHPLLRNQEGEKLSKSKGAASLMEWRKAGRGPQEIYAQVARFAGLKESSFQNAKELLRVFELKHFNENRGSDSC